MTTDFKNLSAEQLKIFDENIEILINDYNQLIDRVLLDMPNRIESLVSNAVSRNVFFNNSLYEIKCLRYLDQIDLKVGDSVIVYHESLKKSILSKYKGVNVILKKEKKKLWLHIAKQYLRTVVKFWHYYKSRSKERRENLVKTKGVTLIDTFMHEDSINKGRFIDRYYCDMVCHVENKTKIFELLFPICSISAEKARKVSDGTNENILFFFDLLKLSDYIKALILPFRDNITASYSYNGYDVTPIIKESLCSYDDYFMFGVLYYCFFKRAKQYGVEIRHVVDWYENQSHDKGLYYGLSKFYPDATVNAYVGFITNPEQTPHNIPTKAEFERGIAPQKIFLCNRWLASYYGEKSGYANCKPASFFRASKIWTLSQKERTDDEFRIIVPLSLNNRESEFKVERMKNLCSKSSQNIKMLLKPHPDTSKEFVDSLIKGNEDVISTVYGSIYDYLIDVDAMIATVSTSIYEAVALGVPIISLRDPKNQFNVTMPKGFDNDIWINVESVSDFDLGISKIKQQGRKFYQNIGNQMKELFFEPVNDLTINEIMNI